MRETGLLGLTGRVTRIALVALTLVTALIVSAPAAQAASVTLNLNVDLSSGSVFGAAPFGFVTLTENGANIDFSVTLKSGFNFVRTGAGGQSNFLFNAIGVAPGEIILTSPFTVLLAPGTSGPAGTFTYGISCGTGTGGSVVGCDQGGPGTPPPLTFSVLNSSFEDFNLTSTGGFYFAADVIGPGGTGLIGLNTLPEGHITPRSVPTPEPASLLCLGLGLVGMGLMRRRSQR